MEIVTTSKPLVLPSATLHKECSSTEKKFNWSLSAREKKLICVTSGNSYLGSQIVKELLASGYLVRVTIENQEDFEDIKNLMREEELNLVESVIVAKMRNLESLCDAFRGCHAIFHTSSFIDPHGISGYSEQMAFVEAEAASNVIKACDSVAYVKRCIFTSSLLASLWRHELKHINERCWSDEEFCRENKLWLALGKTRAEKAAWRKASEMKVNLVVLCPALLLPSSFPNHYIESSLPYLKDTSTNLCPNVEEEFGTTSSDTFEFDINSSSPSEDIPIDNLLPGVRKDLTNNQRIQVYNILLNKSNGGKLSKEVVLQVAVEWGVSTRTITRIWNRGKTTGNVCHLLCGNVGRKRIAVDLSNILQIPLSQRTTLRSLSSVINIPPTTLYRAMRNGYIRRTSNPVKPFLTDVNKIARLEFCLSMIDESTIQDQPIFKDMYNVVHIDEKWFYMTKKSQRYYLLPEEENPLCTCKSKNFIAKVMFLAVTARPRFDSIMTETFSGKIGIFPFVVQVPAKRNSANRSAGTLETKPITSVTRDVMRSFMIGKVLPAIKDKWPSVDSHQPIFIQQDNARTHIDKNDQQFCDAATRDGFDIRLMCQPPNSPDLNILDLGFFAAIQSLQQKVSTRTINELVNAVVESFEAYPTTLSNRIFLTLQTCMIEIMKIKGCNNYKIPHIKKGMLESQSILPIAIICDLALVQATIEYLRGEADIVNGV